METRSDKMELVLETLKFSNHFIRNMFKKIVDGKTIKEIANEIKDNKDRKVFIAAMKELGEDV